MSDAPDLGAIEADIEDYQYEEDARGVMSELIARIREQDEEIARLTLERDDSSSKNYERAWAEMKQERDEARAEIARLRENAARTLPPTTDVVVSSQLRAVTDDNYVTIPRERWEAMNDGIARLLTAFLQMGHELSKDQRAIIRAALARTEAK